MTDQEKIARLKKLLDDVSELNARYRRALEIYSDSSNWCNTEDSYGTEDQWLPTGGGYDLADMALDLEMTDKEFENWVEKMSRPGDPR